jgi:RNA recognition motif-containing protein
MKKLYVGNLPFDVTDAELTELFSPHGGVQSVQIVTDRDTGRSRGFGFVEMSDGADQAIAALNGQDFKGRSLTVNEARPRKEGGGGGRGGFRSGGGGGGGGRRGGFGGRRY